MNTSSAEANAPTPNSGKKLPKTVIGLGIVSLFTDLSSDAIFPLMPTFLIALGASSTFIGVVEGAAEFTANLLKYFSGLWADRHPRFKPIVIAGYSLSTIARPLLALAGSPWHVLIVRICDRFGKGVRSSPRDAWISSLTTSENRAKAYGYHRAMDHAGAAIGTLVSSALLYIFIKDQHAPIDVGLLRNIFLVVSVFGFFSLVVLILTKEAPHVMPKPTTTASGSKHPLPPQLKKVYFATALFAFANASDAFILVMAVKLGASPILAPLLWLCLHLIKSLVSTFGGRLADEYGRKAALIIGWIIYAMTWTAIGFATTLPILAIFTSCYGVAGGLTEGAEKALVAEHAGTLGRGRAFGIYNMLIGFTALVASTVFGIVMDHHGSIMAFTSSSLFAVAAAAALALSNLKEQSLA